MTSEICLERDIEELHVDPGHIVTHPLFEDIHKELAVLFAANGTFGDEVAGLCVEEPLAARLFAPALIGDIDGFRCGAFDDRNKLHPLSAHFISEEPIDRTAVLFICRIHGTDHVEPDSVSLQKRPALHYFVKGALLASVDAIGVVDFARAIHAESNQEIVFLEEETPFIVDQYAVGLKRVFHHLARTAVLFHQLNGALEKLELHQSGFATLPRHCDVGSPVRFEQLSDVGLLSGFRHPVLLVRIQGLLRKEEAVGAIDIACRAARFRKKVEGRRRVGRKRVVDYR